MVAGVLQGVSGGGDCGRRAMYIAAVMVRDSSG
jgi:hypothetical protein